MATSPIVDHRNKPEETFASKKGEVKLCPMCRNATLPPPARLMCRWCLSSGYVAICLPCKGTGIVNAIAAWDGKSTHGSTCDTCGGLKFIPSRESEYEAWLKNNDQKKYEEWMHRNDPPAPNPTPAPVVATPAPAAPTQATSASTKETLEVKLPALTGEAKSQ
jgi:hypothetical protein